MVSDAEYMRLCGQLRKRLPAADVHIFSEASGFGSHSNYTRLGATLHLDDSDLLHVYARMLASDVLVVAPSAFSMVPALIQGGLPAGPSRARCTIFYKMNWARDLDSLFPRGWAFAQNDTAVDECLQRLSANNS
jgi:hypothetical protein